MTSRNEYQNIRELEKMIDEADFTSDDLVLDIGAGSGKITQRLSPQVGKVIAYDIDDEIYSKVAKDLEALGNIEYRLKDFLEDSLPKIEYKVFSNIPFDRTADIVNKITAAESRLVEGYLFMQEEAAYRFVGDPVTTLISVTIGYNFDCTIWKDLSRWDFSPVPDVEVVVLKLARKVSPEYNPLFGKFATYLFSKNTHSWHSSLHKLFTEKQLKHISAKMKRMKWSQPSDLPKEYYYELFDHFAKNGQKYSSRLGTV